MTEQKKTRTYLTTKDNYRLCDYLMKNPPCPGESLEDVLIRADSELHIGSMNEYHVRNRLAELELPLIPRSGPASSELAELREHVKMLEAELQREQALRAGIMERLAKAESAIAAHKLAIQGIGGANGIATAQIGGFPAHKTAGRPSGSVA